MIKLTEEVLLVNGDGTEIYEAMLGKVLDNMFIEIHLVPNENTLNNGHEGDTILCDLLNQTVPQALKAEGYDIISKVDVPYIEEQEW